MTVSILQKRGKFVSDWFFSLLNRKNTDVNRLCVIKSCFYWRLTKTFIFCIIKMFSVFLLNSFTLIKFFRMTRRFLHLLQSRRRRRKNLIHIFCVTIFLGLIFRWFLIKIHLKCMRNRLWTTLRLKLQWLHVFIETSSQFTCI